MYQSPSNQRRNVVRIRSSPRSSCPSVHSARSISESSHIILGARYVATRQPAVARSVSLHRTVARYRPAFVQVTSIFLLTMNHSLPKGALAGAQDHVQLEGGTWQTIKFHTNIRVDGQLLTCAHINHHGPIKYTIEAKSDEIEIPVNVHGDQAFLIKLQRRLSEQEMTMPFISPKSSKSDGYQSILVYDRQRGFRAHVWNFTNVGVYEQVLGHIWAEENQKKMYRWARRVGDHELSVCLDRSPVPVNLRNQMPSFQMATDT